MKLDDWPDFDPEAYGLPPDIYKASTDEVRLWMRIKRAHIGLCMMQIERGKRLLWMGAEDMEVAG